MSENEREHQDPFNLQLQFFELLKRISASPDVNAKAVRFALRWHMHCDVLHSAILEHLETVLARAILAFFICC